MKNTFVLILLWVFGFSAIAQNKEIPLEDFFKNPEKTGYKISPDGKYYSYLAPYKNRLNIFIKQIDTKKGAERITSDTVRDIKGYFWANNNRILYLQDKGGNENFQLFGVNIDGSNLICLTDYDNVTTQIIDDLEDIPDEMIVGLNKRTPMIFDAYRLNIKTGELTLLAENPGNIQGWMTDHDGKLRGAVAIDGVSTSILYREKEKDEFETVLTTNFKESVSPQFFDFKKKNLVYAVSNIGRDKGAAIVFDMKTGKEVKELYSNPDYDVSYIGYSKLKKELTAIAYTSWKREYHFLNEETKTTFEKMRKHLGNKVEIAVTSITKDENRVIIRTYSDITRGSYYLYDKVADKMTKIHDVTPWLKEGYMSEMKPIEYKSRDGLTIHGYLTLPKGKDPKNLPVIINPHGGPWARDTWGFNPEIQFLASRGYAVLQMNFRGSVGYGKEFMQASFKQWGLTMQDDITDGVNWLIEKGIADPERIAIYGGSYGGYATLAGVCFTPDLYCCAIDYVGVSNLFTFMKTIPPYWKPLLNMMYEMVGDPVKDSMQFVKTSPVYNVDKIKAPLFVAQGKNDPRVNIDESDQIVEALKKRGVAVEYMVKDDEGHGFHNEENKFDFYRAMEKFLAKHMK